MGPLIFLATLPRNHCRLVILATVLFGVVGVLLSSSTARIFLGGHSFVAELRTATGNDTRCLDVPVQAPYADLLRVQHCRHSARTGAFVIADIHPRGPVAGLETTRLPESLLVECTGQPVYRVRIVGRETFYARTELHGPSGETHAEYELLDSGSGTFHAEILQLYASFSRCGDYVVPLNDDPLVALHEWHVVGGSGPAGWLLHSSSCISNAKSNRSAPCPPCPSLSEAAENSQALVQGRWIADTSSAFVRELLRELHRTHIRGDLPLGNILRTSSNVTSSSILTHSMLRWQPLQCSLEPTPEAIQRWRHKCKASAGLVCFAGDSQMRHMATQADAVLQARAIPYHNETLKETPVFDWGRYIQLTFGEKEEADRVDWSNCTQLAINVGQWHLSYVAGDRPWSIQAYYHVATELIETIQQAAPHLRGNIFWVSTQPRALIRDADGRTRSPPRDWRTDVYIMQQNEAMRAHCQRPPCKFTDTFAVLDPISDLSYDGGHYLGTPGHWAAALVLQTLCT